MHKLQTAEVERLLRLLSDDGPAREGSHPRRQGDGGEGRGPRQEEGKRRQLRRLTNALTNDNTRKNRIVCTCCTVAQCMT